MRLIVHSNALKHGLVVEQIEMAYQTGADTAMIRSRDRDTDPPRWATIGFEQAGRPVEIVFVQLDGGDVLVFHANWLTKGFAKEVQA